MLRTKLNAASRTEARSKLDLDEPHITFSLSNNSFLTSGTEVFETSFSKSCQETCGLSASQSVASRQKI